MLLEPDPTAARSAIRSTDAATPPVWQADAHEAATVVVLARVALPAAVDEATRQDTARRFGAAGHGPRASQFELCATILRSDSDGLEACSYVAIRALVHSGLHVIRAENASTQARLLRMLESVW